ncbi:MAG: cytochrome c biogenesis protein ResB [Hydrogenophilales bacterium]|nr:cytochrome c biogenesis protein ResB [Hydrogenophilales bacterium]
MSSPAPKNLARRSFDFLSSMPVAIVLLCMVALISMIGTVLEQNRPADHYLAMLGPFWYKTFAALGLYNMYDSWWFAGALVFLMLSMALALVRHGPRIWRQARPLKAPPVRAQTGGGFSLEGPATRLNADGVEHALRGLGFRELLRGVGPDGAQLVFARKGRLSKLGFFLMHGGVIVIAVGGLVTSQFGFRGVMNIPEAGADDIVYVQAGDSYRKIKLPFKVRNDAFAIDYYSTGMPSNYRSDLTLLQGEQKLASERIMVNQPLHYGGITFYQASFGDAGSPVTFVLTELSKSEFSQQTVNTNVNKTLEDALGNKVAVKELRQHNIINLSANPKQPVLRDVGPSLDVTLQSPASGTLTYRAYLAYPNMLGFARMGAQEMTYDDLGFSPADGPMMALLASYFKQLRAASNPAAAGAQRTALDAALRERGLPSGQAAALGPIIANAAAVLQRHRLPMLFALTAFTPKMYTGLQVARDPGSPMVWTGSALLMLGLIGIMYFRERRVWVSLLQNNGRTLVEACGTAGGRFDIATEALIEKLGARLNPGALPEMRPRMQLNRMEEVRP